MNFKNILNCLKVLLENDKESIIVNCKKALKQCSYLKDIVVNTFKNPAPLMSDKTFQKLIPSIQVMFVILFIFLIAFIIRVIINAVKTKRKEKRISAKLSPVRKYSIMAFLTSCTFFFKINPADKGLLVRLVDSVFSFAKLFTFNLSAKEILEKFKDAKIPITDSAIFYSSFISIMVLLCTAFAIFVLISKILNDFYVHMMYVLRSLNPFKKSYLFSEINEKSACLANDIRKKHKLAQIIFAGVNKSELNKEELDYLNSISGGKVNTTSRPITNFHLTKFRKTNVYLIDEEEKNNVKNGKTIFENNKKSNAIINIFSTLRSAETIINSIDKNNSNATINLINPAQIIAYDTLWKHPMFEAAERCGSDTMNVMVVGAGYIGMECAKAAMWCGVMDSFKFKINIVDKEDRKKEFDAQFPDFRKNADEAGILVDYKFHKADVTTSDFTDVLKDCKDANYIIVAIGDDELTMNTTIAIRKWFVRKAVNEGQYNPEKVPTIIPIIRNSDYDALIKDLELNKKADNEETEENKEYYTYSIGSNADIYKQNVIDEWTIERLAKKLHKAYINAQNKNKKNAEYKDLSQTLKRSNRASAVHAKYKIKDEEKSSVTIEQLMVIEHNRWSVFQLLDGWVPMEPEKFKLVYPERTKNNVDYHKVESGKIHADIILYDRLTEVDELYKDTGIDKNFKENDKAIVKYIIEEKPNELYE